MKYYFCESCGNLTTSEQIDDELSNGGMGYCDCQYMQRQWDSETQSFEPMYFRHYPEWTEISEKVYLGLSKEVNTVKRKWMFSSIPKSDINPLYVGDFVIGVMDYSDKDIPGWKVLKRSE